MMASLEVNQIKMSEFTPKSSDFEAPKDRPAPMGKKRSSFDMENGNQPSQDKKQKGMEAENGQQLNGKEEGFVNLMKEGNCCPLDQEKKSMVEVGQMFHKLKLARQLCLEKYDHFISQDPANFMGVTGFEKEHGGGCNLEQIRECAKALMPLVVSSVEHMSENLNTARTNIVISHQKVKHDNPDMFKQPANIALRKLKYNTGIDEIVNTVESMKMGVMCFRLNQKRPPRPEDIEAKLNGGAMDLEELLGEVAEVMKSFEKKLNLHMYLRMSLAMVTFLKDLFAGVSDTAKKNYLVKFGQSIDSLPKRHHYT